MKLRDISPRTEIPGMERSGGGTGEPEHSCSRVHSGPPDPFLPYRHVIGNVVSDYL